MKEDLKCFVTRLGRSLAQHEVKFLDALSRHDEAEIAMRELCALVARPSRHLVGNLYYFAESRKQTRIQAKRRSMSGLLGKAKGIYFSMREIERKLDVAYMEGWTGCDPAEAYAKRQKQEAELIELQAIWYGIPAYVKRRLKQAVARKARRLACQSKLKSDKEPV